MQKSKIAVYIIAVLMLSSAAIYLIAASQESAEGSESGEAEEEGSGMATQVQTAFFAVAGIAYLPVALWMVRSKRGSRTPYVIAMIGSLSLIALYVASRTINLPIVGLQEDVGMLDISSKVIQGAIVTGSAYILLSSRPLSKMNPPQGHA